MPALQVALLHNPSAGGEQHSRAELVGAIERAGHRVVAQFSESAELQASLPACGRCDVVVVAGGDGTVGRAAITLIGSRLPMTILPLGTANNISHTLGIRGSLRHIISEWKDHAECAFDVGLLVTGITTSYFVEALGLGVFPEVIRKANAQSEAPHPKASLERDLSLFRGTLHDALPRMYQVDIDGQDYSGRYLLVQIMNVRYLGPNLELVSDNHPGDGQLEAVLVGETERQILDDLVSGTCAGSELPRSLPTHAAKRVTVITADSAFHLDGDLHRCAPDSHGRSQLVVSILPSALRMWMPPLSH